MLEPILISIGMVADTGEEFYAEVPYPDEKCTSFVRVAVLPQLGFHADFYCRVFDLGLKLQQWLKHVRKNDETVYICFDYTTDWELFLDAIQNQIEPWLKGKLINSEIDEILLEEFYKDTGLSRHHALNDALANKFAYRPLIAKKQIEIRRIKKVGKNWREKLPKQFIKNTLRAIRELRAGMTTTYIFGRIDKKQVLKRTSHRTRQPGLLKGRITIAADFDAPLIISAHTENIPDADDDSDWVRNPIAHELLDVLNDRTIPPHDMPKDTVINEDPMIYFDYFDNAEPIVFTRRESLMNLDMMENPPPRNAAFLEMMEKHEKWKDAQWQQTKPIIDRPRFIDQRDISDEVLVPVPITLLQELGWQLDDVLDIKMNENKELVLRKSKIK